MNDATIARADMASERAFALADIESREALILGKPPRLAPLAVDAFAEEALELTGKIRQVTPGRTPLAPPTLEDVPEIVQIMVRHHELYGRQVDFGIQVAPRSALVPRDREMAILRTGWLCQAPFEWGAHVTIGRKIGLTGEDIDRIKQGSSAPGWGDHERAILRAVEELFDRAMISDETWDALAQGLDEKQLIELPILVGHYQTIAYSQNSLRVRLNPGNEGLKAR